jgi:DNA-damage-inducible protein D
VSSEASNESPFHLEPNKPGFEALSKTNGFRFWWASDLATTLGYESLNGFRKAVERAMMALTSLNIPVFDNIVQEQREMDGKLVADYKLSRFTCYLAAMNGDPKKPQVAQAQSYFVAWAEACRLFLKESDGVERVAIRGEISEHERTLSGTAKRAGVTDYTALIM